MVFFSCTYTKAITFDINKKVFDTKIAILRFFFQGFPIFPLFFDTIVENNHKSGDFLICFQNKRFGGSLSQLEKVRKIFKLTYTIHCEFIRGLFIVYLVLLYYYSMKLS